MTNLQPSNTFQTVSWCGRRVRQNQCMASWLGLAFSMLLSGCSTLVPSNSASLLKNAVTDSVDVRFGVARMVEHNGDIKDALDLYRQLLDDHSDHTEARHRYGIVLLKLERLDEAIEQLVIASEEQPTSAAILGDLGYAHYLAGEDRDAESLLKDALSIEPSDERLANNLALVVGRQGRFDEALQLFRQTGSEAEAQSNIAFVFSSAGKLEQAKRHYHQALELDPKLDVAARGLAEFARLEQSARMAGVKSSLR